MQIVNNDFSLDRIKESDLIKFSNGWHLEGAPGAFYFFGINVKKIFYKVRINAKPNYNRTEKAGDFIEGLWKQDVAELFIGSKTSGEYQEFNISPSGAWWSGYFKSYRESSLIPIRNSGISIDSRVYTDYWEATLEATIESLNISFNKDDLLYNICAISGENPRHFLCTYRSLSKHPDFHIFIKIP